MSDIFSKGKRSQIMTGIRDKGSKIELVVGKILKSNDVRYRSHSKSLPGKPDFYFTKLKNVIFVDSCFWHGCRYHGTIPKSNRRFWLQKISRNRKRDREIDRAYKEMKWRVIRIWEHRLKKSYPEVLSKTLLRTLTGGKL